MGLYVKTCKRCKNKRLNDAFPRYQYPPGSGKWRLHNICRTCWRSKYKTTIVREKKSRRAAIRAIIAYKKDAPCADCGERFPQVCMDFDHLPGYKKLFTIATSVATNRGVKQVKDEIAKCQVVCANCHRVRTHKRFSNNEKPKSTGGK